MFVARDVFYVAIGGALGSLGRYGVSLAAARLFGTGFPWGTLTVNVVGCFVMGVVLEIMVDLEAHAPPSRDQLAFWRNAVAGGFLGGLTTFSTFGGDTIRALQGGQLFVALMNMTANVILSLIAVWCGLAVTQALD